MRGRARAGGFTLVEVLVALLVMSVMAGLAWRGIDGLARAREATQANLETTERINTVVAQLEADLQALYDPDASAGTAGSAGSSGGGGPVPALSCDGSTLRLTRVAEGGVQMVAWQLRSPLWLRWASPAVQRAGELQEQWLRSQQLLGNETGQLRLLEGATGMQIYFFRGNAWTNCQSSAGTAGQIRGVRVVLTLTQPREGTITRSIALGAQP
ncbi:prepilin-type N-terminal cleavage/methylation domain-containing protein [Azohydromonas australica]|uniref:prepilin-type N-terminal cleavage/methylation domain-containing protein n=1 Tax=Azohydromonas australica TaxID=364039 RepID=UPI00040845AB|nr:prepilin-type N-terminal cleavage/methylation domain-containing protein [Azohydromonas australica]